MMKIPFITISSLVPLIEDLYCSDSISSSRFNDHIFCFASSKGKTCQRKKTDLDLIPPPSIYIHMCTLYTYTNIYLPRFSPPGFSGSRPSKCLVPTPGLTSSSPCAVCVCVRVYKHIHSRTLPPASKKERHKTTLLSFLLLKITPHAKRQVLCKD